MTWDEIQSSLAPTLKKLTDSPFGNINEIKFEKGIYIFYENDVPIYVGRSNRIVKRLNEHGKANSTHFSASFAFLLAKYSAKESKLEFKDEDGKKLTRGKLQDIDSFGFKIQKERVAKMRFKAIQIDEPNFQAVFEIYASMQLNTFYNKFDNH